MFCAVQKAEALTTELANTHRELSNAQTAATLTTDLLAERDAEIAMMKDVAGDWIRENCRVQRLEGLLRMVLSGFQIEMQWMEWRDEIRKELGE